MKMHLLSEAMYALLHIIGGGSSAAEHKDKLNRSKIRKDVEEKAFTFIWMSCDSHQELRCCVHTAAHKTYTKRTVVPKNKTQPSVSYFLPSVI